MDQLDMPLGIPEAAAKARELGIAISDWKLYRLVREGIVPASCHGRRMTTVRAIIAALQPKGGLT